MDNGLWFLVAALVITWGGASADSASSESTPPQSSSALLPSSTSTPTPSSITPSSPSTTPTFPTKKQARCGCRCRQQRNVTREHSMTMEELKVKLSAEVKKDLHVNKSSLSKTRNKKLSALDQRLSSRITGCLAITVLGIVFGLPVMSDIGGLIRYFYSLQKRKRVAQLSDAQLAKITDPGAANVNVNVNETDA